MQDIYQMLHGRHVHYGLYSPSPSGYALGVAGFIIHNALPTMQYLLHICMVASSPGSPSPFLTFFARANFIREKSKERESLVRNPAHPWPPGQGLGGHSLLCAFYCSRAAFWTVLTSLTDNKDYLGESFLKF